MSDREPSFEGLDTIGEIAAYDTVEVRRDLELGRIDISVAKARVDALEELREAAGDGWFDRHGPPPPELAHLYE